MTLLDKARFTFHSRYRHQHRDRIITSVEYRWLIRRAAGQPLFAMLDLLGWGNITSYRVDVSFNKLTCSITLNANVRGASMPTRTILTVVDLEDLGAAIDARLASGRTNQLLRPLLQQLGLERDRLVSIIHEMSLNTASTPTSRGEK